MKKIIILLMLCVLHFSLVAQDAQCQQYLKDALNMSSKSPSRMSSYLIFMMRKGCKLSKSSDINAFAKLLNEAEPVLRKSELKELQDYFNSKGGDSSLLAAESIENTGNTSKETYSMETKQPNKKESIKNETDRIDSNYKTKKIDKLPVYPGCESQVEELKLICLSNAIDDIVSANYDRIKASNKTKVNGKIKVKIMILPNGKSKIEVVEGFNTSVDNTVKKLLEDTIKPMSPGISNGKPIEVSIVKPIQIKE